MRYLKLVLISAAGQLDGVTSVLCSVSSHWTIVDKPLYFSSHYPLERVTSFSFQLSTHWTLPIYIQNEPLDNWTTPARVYKLLSILIFYQKEVRPMIDLSTSTIRDLFQKQVQNLTNRTLKPKEETFDFQLSGGWIK